ncbi:MAG: hypothetical protein ACQETH_15295 [Candidatus Rifleibacteriota bacterium]
MKAGANKIFFKPHGFRALLTIDAIALSACLVFIVYFIVGEWFYSGTMQVFLVGLALVALLAFLVMKKPNQYVTVTPTELRFKDTIFLLPKDFVVKFSDIEEVHTVTYKSGLGRSVYLEITTLKGKTHKFAKEIFNKNSDFNEFKRLVLQNMH